MPAMPDIASALKQEIARLARKELRGELGQIRKATSQQRAHIASLRRKVDELERELRRVRQQASKPRQEAQEDRGAFRFRAAGLASHRNRLGLSAADLGRLLGVTGQTVYKWEKGEARPRAGQLPAIAAVRKMGRREALAKLAEDS